MNYYITDGSVKANLDSLPPEAWKILAGRTDSDAVKLSQTVQTLKRCLTIRKDAASSVPFSLVNIKTGKDAETSQNWQGGYGYMPNPRRLLAQFMGSLDFYNAAYALKRANRFGFAKPLQYMVSTSIVPQIDNERGLTGFKRTQGVTQDFTVDDVLYIWLPSEHTEIGPATGSVVDAALADSGVIDSLNKFVAAYFEKGAIRPTILGVPPGTSKTDAEGLQSRWDSMMAGIKNAWRALVFPTGQITPTVIGSGLDGLKNNQLSADAREGVAIATGIPMSIIMSNAANFATATQDEKNLIRWGISTQLMYIAEALTEQVYQPLGYRFEFRTEQENAFQQEEVERASAVSTLSAAIAANPRITLAVMSEVYGYDLTDEQRVKLESALQQDKPEPETEPVQVATERPAQQPVPDMAPAMMELEKAERKALKGIGKPFSFVWYNTPERAQVSGTFADADAVKAAFVHARDELRTVTPPQTGDAAHVLRGLELAVKALEPAPIQPASQTIIQAEGVKFALPEIPAPAVSINFDTSELARVLSSEIAKAIAAIPAPNVTVTAPPASEPDPQRIRAIETALEQVRRSVSNG